jgi:hypothetical protein
MMFADVFAFPRVILLHANFLQCNGIYSIITHGDDSRKSGMRVARGRW